MNKIQLDALCLCFALLGMVTLLPMNKWERVTKKELTFLVYGMVGYVLVVVAWGYLPILTAVFLGGMAIGRMHILNSTGRREDVSVARLGNLVANIGILILMMTSRH